MDDLIPNYEEFRRREAAFLERLRSEAIRASYLAARAGHPPAIDELYRLATRHLDQGLRPLTALERDAREGVVLLECLALFTGSGAA
jgi:hypothetical protein